MKKLCDLFNQYRDGMLAAEKKALFESHMATCSECRARLFLLDNLVHTIRDQHIPDPVSRPAMIADRAYEKKGSWDILLLSWLRPLPIWSGLAALLIILAFLWSAPFGGQSTDYQTLLADGSQEGSTIANLSDAELENWLEQGGTLK
jgi:anti-sigma factor RsiW